MQEVHDNNFPDLGLRERKRAETHARIQAEGMRLFLRDGFEETTLDDVAAAAGVSRRTLMNYFGSKEEIVFSTKAGFPRMVADAVSARPADESLLTMVENALIDLARLPQPDQARMVANLIHTTPSLSAGDQAKYELVERALADALAARKGLANDAVLARVVAGAAVSIMKMSMDAWLANPGSSAEPYVRAAFAALRQAST